MESNQPNLLTLNGPNPPPAVLKRSNPNVENNVVNNNSKLTSLIFSSRSPSPSQDGNQPNSGGSPPKPNQVSKLSLLPKNDLRIPAEFTRIHKSFLPAIRKSTDRLRCSQLRFVVVLPLQNRLAQCCSMAYR